jgi:hypothetical protein
MSFAPDSDIAEGFRRPITTMVVSRFKQNLYLQIGSKWVRHNQINSGNNDMSVTIDLHPYVYSEPLLEVCSSVTKRSRLVRSCFCHALRVITFRRNT